MRKRAGRLGMAAGNRRLGMAVGNRRLGMAAGSRRLGMAAGNRRFEALVVGALVCLLGGRSFAQDEEPSDSVGGDPGGGTRGQGGDTSSYDFEDETVDGELVRPDGAAASAPRPAPVSAPAEASVGHANRPWARSVGIGAGFVFPADITMPSTASVRFKWSDRLTFEPQVTAGGENQTVESTTGGTSREDKVSSFDVELSTLLRWRLASRGKVDLVGLLGPGIRYSSQTTDPMGADNETKDSTISAGVSWGLGLELFPRQHWSVSFDAQNPLVSVASTDRDVPGAGTDRTTTSIAYGVVFDPTVRLMVHLYF